MLKTSTLIHKWLGLIVGLQVLGWVLGGLIMTAIPMSIVKSEHHIAKFEPAALPDAGLVDWRALATPSPTVEATLKSSLRGPLWLLKDAEGRTTTVDAATGRKVSPLTPSEVRFLAGAQYEGKGRPAMARYYGKPPVEAFRPGPLWAVDFDDAERTRFYISPETGEVVARRSNVWRLYDAFWRIHILNFTDGDSFNHPLIIAAAAITLPMTVTGLILLWIRLRRDWIAARRRRRGDGDACADERVRSRV